MIKIIPMEISHLDEVYEIELASFSVPWTKNALLKEIIDNNLAVYFVAVDDDGKVAGYAGLWHVVTEGHITNIAVRPDKRRQGVGAMLLEKLIDTAYEREMIGMTLEVRVNNYDAQRLYSKNGFKLERIRKNYYSDTHEDAIVMWKDL